MTRQRTYIYVGAGAILLYLLYRHFAATNAASAGATNTSGAVQSGADSAQYAALAGQEQSDSASLQATEQSDVQNLLDQLGTLTSTEQGDIQNLQGNQAGQQGILTSLQSSMSSLADQIANLTAGNTHVPSVASGAQPTSRVSSPTPAQTSTFISQGILNQLIARGFKKVGGTGQQGGLPQTGTYTATRLWTSWPSIPGIKPSDKYFVFGTPSTGLHIRAANS